MSEQIKFNECFDAVFNPQESDTVIIKKAQLNKMINDAARKIAELEHKLESVIPALDLLQKRLENGCTIENLMSGWYLVDSSGTTVTRGETLRQMLINLIFVDC